MDNLAFEHHAFFNFGAGNDKLNDLSFRKSIPRFNKYSAFADILGQAGIISILAGENGGTAKRPAGKFS